MSEPAPTRDGAVRRRLRYIWLKLQYDSLAQVLVDGLKLIRIHVFPYRLYVEGLPLDGEGTGAPNGSFGEFEFRPIQPEDIALIAALPDRRYSELSLRRRLEAGTYGLAVWRANELAAFGWCDLKFCNDPCNRFTLNPDEGYLFDAYTCRGFRGAGLAPELRRRMYAELARMGRTKLYSISDSLNKPSIRFKEKLNAQVIDNGVDVQLFGRWRFCWQRNGFRLR